MYVCSFRNFRRPFDLTFDGFLGSCLGLALHFFEEAVFDFESVFGPISFSIIFDLLDFSDDVSISVLSFANRGAARAAL